MKSHIKRALTSFHFWSFFIGLVIGFGGGFILLNAFVPNATELMRLYGLDKMSQVKVGTQTEATGFEAGIRANK